MCPGEFLSCDVEWICFSWVSSSVKEKKVLTVNLEGRDYPYFAVNYVDGTLRYGQQRVERPEFSIYNVTT